MRKLIILLVAVVASTVGAAAMELKDAFAALSNIPNITVNKPDFNLPVVAEVIKDGRIAAGYNMNPTQIMQSGSAAYAILNQVPLAYMINGANNNEVSAFVYATPNSSGTNDILIAVMSGYRGSVVFMYGTVDDAAKSAIQNAQLTMQGSFLSVESTMPDGSDFNIIVNRAR